MKKNIFSNKHGICLPKFFQWFVFEFCFLVQMLCFHLFFRISKVFETMSSYFFQKLSVRPSRSSVLSVLPVRPSESSPREASSDRQQYRLCTMLRHLPRAARRVRALRPQRARRAGGALRLRSNLCCCLAVCCPCATRPSLVSCTLGVWLGS